MPYLASPGSVSVGREASQSLLMSCRSNCQLQGRGYMTESRQEKDGGERSLYPARLSYTSDQERYALVLTDVPDHSLASVCDVVGTQIRAIPALAIRGLTAHEAETMAARLRTFGALVEVWDETASISPPSAIVTKHEQVSVPQPPNTFIILLDPGDKKIQVIKEIRSATSLGLKEAKDLVDAAPSILGPFQAQDAAIASEALRKVGAECEIDSPSAFGDLHIVDVVLTKHPSLAEAALPDALIRLLHSYASDGPPNEPVVIATGINAYLAERIMRVIGESGGEATIESKFADR